MPRRPQNRNRSPKANPKVRKLPAKTVKSQQVGQGTPGHEQDPKRRLGNFTGPGEHARLGSRVSGIVGQTTKRGHTDRGTSKRPRPKKLGKGLK